MSTVTPTGRRASQLQLPLPFSRPEPGGEPVPDRAAPEWRLDDHTRRIGHQGVAAARALLEGRGRAGRRPADGSDDRKRQGRAA